ncbi:MAG: sphingomyelin phosphodiesterase acid-like 3 [Mucilaginibacter sp.]|nr:sphingomyelin phosphodiesterase acid-like 3 [Mucilaginibacter sp.]
MKHIKKHFPGLFLCLMIVAATILSFAFSVKTIHKPVTTQKCLIVSDIHFDPMYGSTDTSLKRRLAASSVAEWKKYFESSPAQMTLDASLLGKDANYAVLQSAIANMKKRLPHPAFIIIAGDFIWHNATIGDSTLKKKSVQFIARMFKNTFPGVPIIPALGNNDTYGNNYTMQGPRFLKDFAEAREPSLPKPSADSLKVRGYYTCQTDNLRLMVINSSLLSFKNNYPQAATMLAWLQNNLVAAHGKNVWIISHIPPGTNGYDNSNFWNPQYTGVFVNTIVKYAPQVKFMIASHTHFNEFKVVYNASGTPISYLRVVPSVCSNHGNNPSFEIAEYDHKTGKVINETNHYLNLAAIPTGKGSVDVTWKDKLDLKSSLELSELNAANFFRLINNVKNQSTGETFKAYVNFYNVGTPIDSSKTINHSNYLNYLRADSLKGGNNN